MNASRGRDTTALATVAVGVGSVVLLVLWRRQRKQSTDEATRPSITTTIVSERMVTANPTVVGGDVGELREKLSEVDEWLTRSSHWLGFTLRFDELLDADQVESGLAHTLAHIPALGARVDTTSNPIQYELVLTPERQGVVLEVARGIVEDGGAAGFLHADAIKLHFLPGDSSPREAWQKAGLGAPAAGFEGEPGPDDPVMRVRLTVFPSESVSYLAIGMSHGLCDGYGICDVLQVWSHFCATSLPNGLPESLRRPRTFGRRVTEPVRPAKDKAELERRRVADVESDVDPLSGWAFYRYILPRVIWCVSRQRVLEIRVHADRMAALKTAVSEALPDGEWVSTFELLCAALLTAQRATADTTLPSKHALHVACNLRDRAKRFEADYFGNAAFDFCESLVLPETTMWDLTNIVKIVKEVHRAVREGIKDPDEICKTKDWFEAARHLGMRNTYDVWPLVVDLLRGSGTFMNSWDSRWMNISMGGKQDAVSMVAHFGVVQNLFVEVPRHRSTGDSTVYLALPPKNANRFIALCSDENKLPIPFSIVSVA